MITKVCKCGNEFVIPNCRRDKAKYCSRSCCGKYNPKHTGKCPKGSLAKMGDKNPMYGKPLSPEHRRKIGESLRTSEKVYRVSPEHKRNVKRACEVRRRLRLQQNSGYKGFSADGWMSKKMDFDYRCAFCNRQEPEIKLTADHIKPVALGGDNNMSNIQPLCVSCNSKKGAKYETIA